MSEELDPPTDPNAEYEWLGISTCIKNGWKVEDLTEHEGWEFYWGALRRPVKRS